MSKKNVINEALLKQMADSNPETVVSALEQIKVNGNSAYVEPLLHLLQASSSEEVVMAVRHLLGQLKDEQCTPILIHALSDSKYDRIHDAIVGALWQSGLKCEPYLTEIVEASIKGNYSVAVECMTVIEAMEGELAESVVVDAIKRLKDQITKQGDKNLLLVEIIEILQNRLMD